MPKEFQPDLSWKQPAIFFPAKQAAAQLCDIVGETWEMP
jgi:hypothetical protein